MVIDNRAGGGGTIGPATMAANAKPDGYTLSQIPDTVYRVPLMQKAAWDAEQDFTYVILLTGYTFAIAVPGDSQFKTWQDVVSFAKANPGKITYGSSGAGTSNHLGVEMIAQAAGIKLTHVPFKGATEVQAAAAGGHVMLASTGSSARGMVDAGKLRFLNVWTSRRVSFLPEVPTLKDLGYPLVIDSPFGIAGPKGMDPKIVAKLHDAFKTALSEPSVEATLKKFDMSANYKNSADYRAYISELVKQETDLLKSLGLYKPN